MLSFILNKATSKFSTATINSSYKILGVQKGTSIGQIKKKYYELAKQYHPDVNKEVNAHQKFAEITKAYNFIIDNGNSTNDENVDSQSGPFAKHGKRHNPYQTNSQKRSKASFQQDWEDFQTFDEYYRSYKKYKKAKKGEDIYVSLSISLKQAFMGAKRKIKFTRKINCPECTDQEPQTCISCGGKGEIFHRKLKEKQQCTSCNGFGYKLECSCCNGTRQVSKDVQEQVYIEKNTHDKSILRVKNNGHQGYKHVNGDLYVTVLIEQNQKMRIDGKFLLKQGNNVHSQIELEYLTAVFGGDIEIQTVQGTKSIAIPSGTQSGHEMRLFNYGIKSAFSQRVGDHVFYEFMQILKFKIKVPKKLSTQQKKLMSELMREDVREVL